MILYVREAGRRSRKNMSKRLSILHKNDKFFIKLIALLFLFVLVVRYDIVCSASERKTECIKISASYSNIYSRDTTLDLGIDFSNYNDYNNNLYISYHIYDAQSGDCVLYDNERRLIDKKSNQSKILVSMDIKIPKELRNKKLYITYDILDLNSETWLSQKEGLLEADVTNYEKNMGKSIRQKLKGEIYSRPVIFCINIVVFVGMLLLIVIIKNKKIYE